MKTIPLNAVVKCTDGPAGRSQAVIIDPGRQRLTHIVVRDNKRPWSRGRLVPVERIRETSQNLVLLDCSRRDLARLKSFITRRYVQKETHEYPSAYYAGEGPAYTKAQIFNVTSVEVERVPTGKLVVHHGDSVQAIDGQVGQVEKILVEPSNHRIAYLVALRRRILPGQDELVVPAFTIERIDRNVIYLDIDRETVDYLSAGLAERDFAWQETETNEGESGREKVT
jgi:uncharacterized protein YwbE